MKTPSIRSLRTLAPEPGAAEELKRILTDLLREHLKNGGDGLGELGALHYFEDNAIFLLTFFRDMTTRHPPFASE